MVAAARTPLHNEVVWGHKQDQRLNAPNITPFVSVVIPTHNRANFIRDAVTSALNQGAAVGEVIVVDDGSTDDTSAVLLRVADPRLRVLRQPQSGPAIARHNGWRAARGQWILFLDSDDALETGAAEALLATAQQHPGRIPFGLASVHAQTVDSPPAYTFCFAHRSGSLLKELSFYSAGTILSCLFPRATLSAVGGFNEMPESPYREDFEFALRLALRCEFAHLPRVCYRIRMHAGNRHRPQQRKAWEFSIACLDRCLGLHPRHLLLRQRAKAYFRGLMADEDLERGEARAALGGYLQSLAWWPVKLGAWKGLLRTAARLLKPGPALPPTLRT